MLNEECATRADAMARAAKNIKASPYPWRDLAIEELPHNDYADFAGFERWFRSQDDLLDAAHAEMDVDQKAALFLAFVAACDFAEKVAKDTRHAK